MVLVDTSVWIRAFRNRPPYVDGLRRLALAGNVAGHELIFGELLVGDVGGREKFLADYELMPQLALAPHQEVVHMVRGRKLHGRGAGWIDIHLLASALVAHVPLWTADEPLLALAQELGIAYKPR
jgi:predicted nucleic acid-binding protein